MDRMTNTHRIVLIVVALVCLAIAEILTLGWVHGSHATAWMIGGFIAFVASFLPKT
jgi:hypothetical protein